MGGISYQSDAFYGKSDEYLDCEQHNINNDACPAFKCSVSCPDLEVVYVPVVPDKFRHYPMCKHFHRPHLAVKVLYTSFLPKVMSIVKSYSEDFAVQAGPEVCMTIKKRRSYEDKHRLRKYLFQPLLIPGPGQAWHLLL